MTLLMCNRFSIILINTNSIFQSLANIYMKLKLFCVAAMFLLVFFVGCVATENRENTGLLQVATGKNWRLWTETMTMTTMLRFTRLVVESDALSFYIVVHSVHVFRRKFDVNVQTSQCSR